MIVAELSEKEVRSVFRDRKIAKLDKKFFNIAAILILIAMGLAAMLIFGSFPLAKEAGYGIKYYEVPALQEETILVLNDMPSPTINGVELKSIKNDTNTIATSYILTGLIILVIAFICFIGSVACEIIIASRFADVATAVYKESGKIMEA